MRALLIPCLLVGMALHAQQPEPSEPSTETSESPSGPVTIFPHSDATRWLLAGQANIIFQAHPGFHSPYEGTNSLLSRGEYKTSLLGTFYMGYQLIDSPKYNLDGIFDIEAAGGRGASEALGLAGFTNLDVVRNPNLGSEPYIARMELHQTIGLTDELTDAQRNPFSLATKVPIRRLEFRAGKMSMPDTFDINNPGSDSHLQFMNWTADNNGAWDYAADTRGYTYSFITEYDDHDWTLRYGLALMPSVANGIDVVWNLRQARGENYELDWNKGPLSGLLASHGNSGRKGAVRVLGYLNHANMGDYHDQIKLALAQRSAGDPTATPDITAHPLQVTTKYGATLNFEQELTQDLRIFGRFGWNDGQHESYAYTEVDQTFELGGDFAGNRWGRPNDKIGVVGISNAIKRYHQQYLAMGGLGFILGDGNLSYAREDILEAYYTAHNWRGLFTAFDMQFIDHPGYDQARGPVAMFSIRTHVDF